jgi:hypothetical protein
MSKTQRPLSQAREIGGRLLAVLQDDLGLTLTQAAAALGYTNASTLHRMRRGEALPDPARLGRFATQRLAGSGRAVNLHWVLTGTGRRFVREKAVPLQAGTVEIDIINYVRRLDPSAKRALLTLLEHAGLAQPRAGRRQR